MIDKLIDLLHMPVVFFNLLVGFSPSRYLSSSLGKDGGKYLYDCGFINRKEYLKRKNDIGEIKSIFMRGNKK